MRDYEPTKWPESVKEARRIAEGTFSHCIGENNEDPEKSECVGCPGYTTQSGDWCGAVYLAHVSLRVDTAR